MIEKKHASKDIKNKRFDFFLIGLALSLLAVLGAFSYTQYERKQVVIELDGFDEEFEVTEITVQKRQLPPPPPEIVVVEDDVVLDEDEQEIIIYDLDLDDELVEFDDLGDEELEDTDEELDFFAVSDPALFMGEEVMLAFPRYMQENLEYPRAAQEAEVEGTVLVSFRVNKNGQVDDIHVISKPIGYGCEAAAIRLIESTNGMWTAAKQRDKPVNVRYKLPIQFTLY